MGGLRWMSWWSIGWLALACGDDVGGADTDGSSGGDSSASDGPTTAESGSTETSASSSSASSSDGDTSAVTLDGTSSTDESSSSGTTGGPIEPGPVQAIPPARLREVCESLGAGCCLQSACAPDLEVATTCFTDRVQEAVAAADDDPRIDILFVVDNTVDTGPIQLVLARETPGIVARLQALTTSGGGPLEPDVNIMVTTTDFGNPLCTPFATHESEQGAPVATGCNERIDRFTSLDGAQVYEEACTELCPSDIEPEDPFIHFDAADDNVPDVPDVDIDGDGVDDPAMAQALACLAPQGLDGCGYEQPLENMLQALNPGAEWNSGGAPFIRPEGTLGIVIVTNEADCSIQDYTIMEDASLQEVNPAVGIAQASSAICWNAGVQCEGPDDEGVYGECVLVDNGLQPITRYTGYLESLGDQGKQVVMLGIVGIPESGARDLVIRDWRDEDILPEEAMAGVTAQDKQFLFGIGPGCGGGG